MKLAVGFNADLPVNQILLYAKLSEELGFDGLWLHEHTFARDALSYLSAAAQSTSKLRLGAACLSPYTRHAVVLAMSMLTLQESSHGRAILGLGTGFPMRLDLLAIDHQKPIAALKETIEICRKIWNGEVLNYKGSVFSLTNVKSISGKAYSKIPIYIAGWKKQMLMLTGKYADGYVAKGGESPQSLGRIVNDIKESAQRNGRRIEDIEIAAYVLTHVAKTKSEAFLAAKKDPFVSYMLSVQDDYLYEETGINPELKKPIAQNYFKGNLEEASSKITEEMMDAFTLCGTADQVCDRLEDYERAGLNLPILQPISMKHHDIQNLIQSCSGYVLKEMNNNQELAA